MTRRPLSLALALAIATPTLALADSTEDRLARMEAMLAEMQRKLEQQEARLRSQQDTIDTQAQQLAERQTATPASAVATTAGGTNADHWTDRIELSGTVEIEASQTSDYAGGDESDIVVATAEIGMAAQVNDWVAAEITLLYEEDDTPLDVDVAQVTIANADASPLYLTGGQFYLPFGTYDTNLLSDPLTLEIGEGRETALQLGMADGAFDAGVFLFNGDNAQGGDNDITGWGGYAGWSTTLNGGSLALSAGYLNDLGDTDSLQEVINANLGNNDTERTDAWTLAARADLGPISLIGEYLAALDTFEAAAVGWGAGGAKPSAWNLEAGYAFALMGKDATIAIGYQGTEQALGLELPERRLLAALSVGIYANTTLSIEWSHDDDYSVSDGGTGDSANALVAQLAVTF